LNHHQWPVEYPVTRRQARLSRHTQSLQRFQNTNDSAAKDFKSCIDYSLKINGLFQLGALFIAYVWDKYYVNCLRQGQGEEEM